MDAEKELEIVCKIALASTRLAKRMIEECYEDPEKDSIDFLILREAEEYLLSLPCADHSRNKSV